MRILLVDDEEELVSTLADRLALRGIYADWVTSCEDALEKLETETYDIAVLDVKIPRMSGIELGKRLKEKDPDMGIIFMTGHGSDNDFRAGSAEAGAENYLIKPVDIELLLKKINQALEKLESTGMSYKWDIIGNAGLQFLGKMNASISHEIKNVLAILNENAGLLKDYCLMADKGKPIDTGRQKTLAGKITEQVRRADSIVNNMNRLAHSVDHLVMQVDLDKIVEFMADLSRRFASMKGVTLEITPSKGQVTITTNPFFLENLIWLCLDFAMDVSGEETSVGLVSEATEENGARIRFTRLEALAGADTGIFPGERERALLDALTGEIENDLGAKEIVITLPGQIGH